MQALVAVRVRAHRKSESSFAGREPRHNQRLRRPSEYENAVDSRKRLRYAIRTEAHGRQATTADEELEQTLKNARGSGSQAHVETRKFHNTPRALAVVL